MQLLLLLANGTIQSKENAKSLRRTFGVFLRCAFGGHFRWRRAIIVRSMKLHVLSPNISFPLIMFTIHNVVPFVSCPMSTTREL